nr:hypothetical protein [Tanacetum cinerariifolium]
MHNNIMAAGSRDLPLMLATGRHPQWRSRFLRYIDTRPNGDALRKCILNGPYIPTTVVIQAIATTDDSPVVPEHTTLRKYEKLSKGYNKPEWSRFVTIVKQQHKLDEVSYHKLFDILKQYQKEVNELYAERLARNANPLALVATAQANQDPYYQTSKSQKSYTPSSKPLILTRSHTTTRYKGKEIAKSITPPSESASEEDSDPEQAQGDKDMQKNLDLIAKYFKKIYKPTNNNLRTSSNSRNKNVDTTPEQYDWLADTDEEIDEHELEAHYNYIEKIQDVPTADLGTDSEPLEQAEFEKYKAFNDHTVDYDKLKQIVDNAWVKHTKDQFRAPTANDMDILIKTCLMPLTVKTQNDSFIFVHELNQEMNADLTYVESFKKEIDELESDKTKFSNMYDMILQECVSNKVMCNYLFSLPDLDALAELQCLYLHKVKECDCLAQKLLKQTESVRKEVYTELLQCFAKLEKHSISLELALQQCKEHVKNDTVCNEQASNVFRKERGQYLKIQDLKAQLQDKNIAISELKKLIEKYKEKSMYTKFDKPSVVRQTNAQRIPKP